MKTYLEYKDENSAKFWTIEVKGTDHTVTYGKIGTTGQSKTKTFDSPEKALQEAEKLVKAKFKKGYQEVASAEEAAPLQLQFLEVEVAQERFNLKQYDPLGSLQYDAIVLIEGDVSLGEGLFDDSIADVLFNGQKTTEAELIIIEGNLTIKGDLSLSGETGYPSLLVLGDVHCESLCSYDNVIHIEGDAYLKYLFYGDYNHGSIKIAGTTYAPYIINSDHDSDLNPSDNAIVINVYGNYDDFFVYDYYSKDLGEVMVKEVLYYNKSYDGYEFDFGLFAALVEAGKSPFKEGAKPKREKIADEITALAGKSKGGEGLKELDLSEKKLLELPAALFEMKTLEVLNLSKNDFTVLPEEIGQLTNLRELNLGTTSIKELPAAIAQLKNLEVLNLRYCRQLKRLPEAIGALHSLKHLNLHAFQGEVPQSIAKLKQLEELNITRFNVQGQLYNCQPIAFPEWVGTLKSLKKLEASENAFTSLPDALSNLSELECLNLTCSTANLEEITDLSKLVSLKELKITRDSEIRGVYMPLELLSHFFKIKSLECLSLSRFDGGSSYGKKRRDLTKKDFKGLDQLVNLRELKIFGIISDGLPEEITKLKQLQKISINTKHFSKEDKKTLKGLKLEVKLLN